MPKLLPLPPTTEEQLREALRSLLVRLGAIEESYAWVRSADNLIFVAGTVRQTLAEMGDPVDGDIPF
jgi:hypothetical protein